VRLPLVEEEEEKKEEEEEEEEEEGMTANIMRYIIRAMCCYCCANMRTTCRPAMHRYLNPMPKP
jgi:hypothetical protein